MIELEPQNRSAREMVRLLRAFEGWRCFPRLATAAITFAAVGLLPVVGAVGGIYIGAPHVFPRIVLGVVVSVGFGSIAARIARHAPWRTILLSRLWTYEEPNPLGFVELLVQSKHFQDTFRVLRRARFMPRYGARVGSPPSDAPELTLRIGVEEPAAWARSTSDEDRLWRIASVLAAAGIRARVAGIEAFPGGRAEPRRTETQAFVGAESR
jgi:hypothetical protein